MACATLLRHYFLHTVSHLPSTLSFWEPLVWRLFHICDQFILFSECQSYMEFVKQLKDASFLKTLEHSPTCDIMCLFCMECGSHELGAEFLPYKLSSFSGTWKT